MSNSDVFMDALEPISFGMRKNRCIFRAYILKSALTKSISAQNAGPDGGAYIAFSRLISWIKGSLLLREG